MYCLCFYLACSVHCLPQPSKRKLLSLKIYMSHHDYVRAIGLHDTIMAWGFCTKTGYEARWVSSNVNWAYFELVVLVASGSVTCGFNSVMFPD